MKHYQLALAKSNPNGEAITTSGGNAYVTAAGGTAKLALFNKDGTTLANPIALTNGKVEFYTADSMVSVDVYGQAPTGHGFVVKGAKPSGNNEIFLSTGNITTLIIPFNIADTTANTETDTGFDLPTNALVQPQMGLGVDVATADSGHTILFGMLSSESGGDADGLSLALSLTNVATVPCNFGDSGTALNANTFGALTSGYLAGATGWAYNKQYRCDGTAKSVSYTLASGTVTGAGFIRIPMTLSAGNVQ